MFLECIMLVHTKIETMKNKILAIGAFMFLITTLATAQICPPQNSGRYITPGFASYTGSSLSRASADLRALSYSFSNVINRGYSLGNLTRKEVWQLEGDFDRLVREMRFAYTDGRVSFHERTMIDRYTRRLQRNIESEWYDRDKRAS